MINIHLSFLRPLLIPAFVLAACSSSKSSDDASTTIADGSADVTTAPDTSGDTAPVGAAGGTVTGPLGAKAEVPAGALAQPATLTITEATAGTPGYPSGVTPASAKAFLFLPHGTTFLKPVTISVPFTGSAANLEMLTADPGGSWTTVRNAKVSDSVLTAEVMHYSFFVAVRRDGVTADAGVAPDSLPNGNDTVTAEPDAAVADTAVSPDTDEPDVVADCGRIKCDCTFNGKKLYGRIWYVMSNEFPDVKVKETQFPDLRVKETNFPNKCGEWEIVKSLPALKVAKVLQFEDFQIEYSDFPGIQ